MADVQFVKMSWENEWAIRLYLMNIYTGSKGVGGNGQNSHFRLREEGSVVTVL